MTLEGKVALVTGGGRGIGRAIAERLGSDGAIVGVNFAKNAVAADDVVAGIVQRGGRAFAVQADIADLSSITRLFRELDAKLAGPSEEGKFDILVNNAGTGVFAGVESTTLPDFENVFATNVRGTFFTIQMALTRLRSGGRIINISSGAVRQSEGAVAAYTMSKAAIESLTVMLARQLGPRGITVNAVAPGWTETDINAEARKDPNIVNHVISSTALGRFGKPTDIANVVAFLVSPAGGWVTGQVIEASGGHRL